MPLSCDKNLQSTTCHDNLLVLARDGMEMYAGQEDMLQWSPRQGCSGLGVRVVLGTVIPALLQPEVAI